MLINNIILHVDQHINPAVDQRFKITLLINSIFLVVDQQWYHKPLINAVATSVDQRPLFERQNTWVTLVLAGAWEMASGAEGMLEVFPWTDDAGHGVYIMGHRATLRSR